MAEQSQKADLFCYVRVRLLKRFAVSRETLGRASGFTIRPPY